MSSHETLHPDSLVDPPVQAALRIAAQGEKVVSLSGLLAAIVMQRDRGLERLLGQALRPPATMSTLFAIARQRLGGSGPLGQVSRTETWFSPAAQEVLVSFESRRQAGTWDVDRSLELLFACVLERLDEQEIEEWAILDRRVVLTALRERLEVGDREADRPEDVDNPDAEARPPIPPEVASIEDLTQRARLFRPSHASPMEGELAYERLFDHLARALHRQGMHLLLVGDRGVGQAILLAEFARRAALGHFSTLRDKRFFLVDCRHTSPELSGNRLLAILAAVARRGDLVVCLNGFASLLRGERGTTNKGLLLSALPRLKAKVIGLLGPREYEELVAEDADMGETFVAAEAPEPGGETACRLLTALAAGLEDAHCLKIDPDAILQAVVLTDRYILHERLPGKALKVLRQVCEDIAYEREESGSARQRVTADDVIRAVARASGVPEETLRGVAERGDYAESLGREIFGQTHAVKEVATELGLIKAGLTEPGKPASVMLFIGQTGTGKTEMAKTLAQFYSRSKRLRTYTLGNFIEPHSVAGIIGVPPGYVGHEQGGRIVSDLLADPYCVFLLDEADKAHPDVLQPFLNLFDEGWICDQRGVKAYADKAIFILTTNVGQRMLADMAREGKTPEEMEARMKEALAQIRHSKSNRPVFAPEFLARIKRVIVFQPLGKEAMEGICRKHLRQMQESWRQKRRKELVVPESLLEHIGEESHGRNQKTEGREGGRIVRKLMADLIETPIQRAATADPAAYQTCKSVVLETRCPTPVKPDTAVPPEVMVRFEPAAGDGSPQEEIDHVG
jgi:ATP-dependent Clp protease ATP-binding subunit ClpC